MFKGRTQQWDGQPVGMDATVQALHHPRQRSLGVCGGEGMLRDHASRDQHRLVTLSNFLKVDGFAFKRGL